MLIYNSVASATIKTFDYSGRSERLEHWSFLLFTLLMGLIITVFHQQVTEISAFPLNWIVLLAGTWFALANVSLLVRRMHDIGLSGFYLIMPMMSLIGLIILQDADLSSDFGLSDEVPEWVFPLAKYVAIGTLIGFASLISRAGDREPNVFGSPV